MANLRVWVIVAFISSCAVGAFAQPSEPLTDKPASPEMAAGETPTVRPSNVEADQPATPVTDVPSPAEPDHWKEQAIWALIGAQFLQYLKKRPWFPFLGDTSSQRVKAVWGFGLALLTAAGINFSITGSVMDTDGATITFSGVSLSALMDIAWQWGAQQGWYRLVVQDARAAVVVKQKITKVKVNETDPGDYPA